VSLVGVVCESPARSERWAREHRLPYPLLVDEDRNVARAFGVYKALGFDSFRMAQPSAFIIDTGGIVRYAALIKDERTAPSPADYLARARALSEPSSASTIDRAR
jgi:peroxiredoxin